MTRLQVARHRSPAHRPSLPFLGAHWDLVAAGTGMVLAMILSFTAANQAMAWFTLSILGVVPGYVLIQTIRPTRRLWHIWMAVGLSIPVLGLLALLTALVPGGFKVVPIVLTVTAGVLLMSGFAFYRRRTRMHQVPSADDAAS